MLDFLDLELKGTKKGVLEGYPDFLIIKSKDIMIRGGNFYALWDEERSIWITDEFEAIKIVDKNLIELCKRQEIKDGPKVVPMLIGKSKTGAVQKWINYTQRYMPDTYHQLDEKIIFANEEIKKEDYATKQLAYPITEMETPAYDRLIGTLYSEEERHKIEWAIGAIISGDSKWIQKFLVFYGSAGTGKSTVLNIIQWLFDGYYAFFDAKALGSKSDSFALEPFENNPLVAIQHDGDLSKIEDNTRLNSLVSHESLVINSKFKSLFSAKFNSFLLMGTNRPVRISDAKSGILRRLIDVSPTGNKVSSNLYTTLMNQIKFELGGIAYHCLDVYEKDKDYYDDYRPSLMIGASNDFYNFVLEMYDKYCEDDMTTLKSSWAAYKEYCLDANVQYPFSMRIFKEELRNYFVDFQEKVQDNGTSLRNVYTGFKKDLFEYKPKVVKQKNDGIIFKEQPSILDEVCAEYKAQYANEDGTPKKKWDEVGTKLKLLDTSQLHYVMLPKNHIVIDFDLKDKNGDKSFEKNLEAASLWPPTYAELSKSGKGIHLHYIYDGDVEALSRLYSEDIEVKVFTGKSSLRRKLTKCNDLSIRTINSGIPLKGGNKVINFDVLANEKALRTVIAKNLRKEYHSATKPSIDFIYKALEDAYNSGMIYDVSDMKPSVLSFAAGSSHNSDYCIRLVNKMKWASEEKSQGRDLAEQNYDTIIFYDVEVFSNLFVIVWKAPGGQPVKMINPKKEEVEELIRFKLVGFNCRRYDNHILYAAMMGYSNEELYKLSQKIINAEKGKREGFFSEAWNLSYTDIYDYAQKKQSLKKWEIELGIHHQELGLPWDQPAPKALWETVADYCINDVLATEAVWEATQGDFTARKILAELSGLSVNDTTNSHTTRIIFGKEKNPKLEYTYLEDTFPGYQFVSPAESEDHKPHNYYRGEDVGFGGYVYANPGMYGRTVTFDVASQHPSSIIAMNCFGEYTEKFKNLLDIRIAIKHKDYDKVKRLDPELGKYLDDPAMAKSLAGALKIAINSVYGLTSASFDNPFRDPRNVNNIVALRGALFMVTLRDEVVKRGYTVVHIKTDSIKILEPDEKITEFVLEFGKKYGYNFEVEHVFDRICLVNDAVYIGKLAEDDPDDPGKWTATGTQFAVPYVFKTLFSREPITFEDQCETKAVSKGDIYLDMNEDLPEDEHNYTFVGKVGQFCPVIEGSGGGLLYRYDGVKYNAVSGTKGYRWMESEVVKRLGLEDRIDKLYYSNLVNDAYDTISEYGDVEAFCV